MSGRSLASAASTTIKHPDLHEPGLNASLVEAVSCWFEQGKVTKAMVIGQVALAYNPIDISAGPFGTESIRLENFPVLEKVAPNPAFIEQTPDSPGNYTVDLSKILKTTVAFHYQLHLDADNLANFAPLTLTPVWKPEAAQTSAILHYSLNPRFYLPESASSLTLHNLVLVCRLEPGVRTTSCQSKPAGTFSREKSLIYWRLGDVTLTRDAPAQSMRVRFFTDGEARPGNTEARWEVSGKEALGLGSGLGVSMAVVGGGEKKDEEKADGEGSEGEKDPFADADAEEAGGKESAEKERERERERESEGLSWKPVASVKKITSGTYLGV